MRHYCPISLIPSVHRNATWGKKRVAHDLLLRNKHRADVQALPSPPLLSMWDSSKMKAETKASSLPKQSCFGIPHLKGSNIKVPTTSTYKDLILHNRNQKGGKEGRNNFAKNINDSRS